MEWRLSRSISPDEMVVRLDGIIRAGCSEHTILSLERIQFIKQIGSTQLSALLSIVVLIALGVHEYVFSPLLVLALLIGVLLTLWIYLDKSLQQEKVLWGLENNKGSVKNSPR